MRKTVIFLTLIIFCSNILHSNANPIPLNEIIWNTNVLQPVYNQTYSVYLKNASVIIEEKDFDKNILGNGEISFKLSANYTFASEENETISMLIAFPLWDDFGKVTLFDNLEEIQPISEDPFYVTVGFYGCGTYDAYVYNLTIRENNVKKVRLIQETPKLTSESADTVRVQYLLESAFAWNHSVEEETVIFQAYKSNIKKSEADFPNATNSYENVKYAIYTFCGNEADGWLSSANFELNPGFLNKKVSSIANFGYFNIFLISVGFCIIIVSIYQLIKKKQKKIKKN